jgi:hypothetical protein
MANKGNLGAVYAGRFVAGLGVGQTVVVAPIYLAEIVSSNATAEGCVTTVQFWATRLTNFSLGSRSDSRSLHLCLHWFRLSRYVLGCSMPRGFTILKFVSNQLLFHLGIVLAYFANYGCQVHMGDNTHKRWVRTDPSLSSASFPHIPEQN